MSVYRINPKGVWFNSYKNREGLFLKYGLEMLKFFNTREYVLFRDNHTCRCCKGKSKDNRLNVHHIESRKIGGNL